MPDIAALTLDQAKLEKAVKALSRTHPEFRAVVKQHGLPSLRASEGGLSGLLQMVTEQFLSLAAAAAIWKRLSDRLTPLTPTSVLACPQEELVGLGLSRAKAKSFHGIASAILVNTFSCATLATMDDTTAHKSLVALPGIGPWTADIYLLSVLLRCDAWPWGDVALQAAAQDLFQLDARPGKAEMIALGERFSPSRAVAARLLWAHYRGLKKMSQA
jgi:DNA-3-methyladenine glycosylase II